MSEEINNGYKVPLTKIKKIEKHSNARNLRNDMTGKRSERLSIIKRIENKNNKVMYECQCDCGNIVEVRADSLQQKKFHNTRSCGCLQKEKAKEIGIRCRKDPYIKLNNDMYVKYRRRCILSNKKWDISKEDFKNLINANCHYCNSTPSNKLIHPHIKNEILLYNGIDRIDSSKGYEFGNVLSCCAICNYAKNDYSIEEFYEWANRICKNLKQKGIIND